MKRKNFLLLLFLTFCIGVSIKTAGASCGAAICPLNVHHNLTVGQLHIQLLHEYINQNQINVGSEKSFVGALPNAHDEIKTINQRTLLELQYGITGRFGLKAELPFIQREHSHIEDSTVESFGFDGVGDLKAVGEYTLPFSDWEFSPRLTLLAGIKFPTGKTDAANEDGEVAEITIQPGTGSWDGIFGLNLKKPLFRVKTVTGGLYSNLPVTVGVTYQVNGKGKDDYKFGEQILAHVGTEYLLFPHLSLLFQTDGRWQDFADVGTAGEYRSNTGGTWIFVSPGLNVQFNQAFSAYVYAQLPVYQKVNGIQQVAKLNLQVGLSANVNLLK